MISLPGCVSHASRADEVKPSPDIVRSPGSDSFESWAHRKHLRQCACEWQHAGKCARNKSLIGSQCPCVCH
jgi:hypothetical protein